MLALCFVSLFPQGLAEDALKPAWLLKKAIPYATQGTPNMVFFLSFFVRGPFTGKLPMWPKANHVGTFGSLTQTLCVLGGTSTVLCVSLDISPGSRGILNTFGPPQEGAGVGKQLKETSQQLDGVLGSM